MKIHKFQFIFLFIASALIASCKKSVIKLDDFPNGRYVGEFVNDSIPSENYTKEFIGVKGSQIIFTSIELDSFHQDVIVIEFEEGFFYRKYLPVYTSIPYDISASSTKIIGQLKSSFNSTNPHNPTSFTLTYAP